MALVTVFDYCSLVFNNKRYMSDFYFYFIYSSLILD